MPTFAATSCFAAAAFWDRAAGAAGADPIAIRAAVRGCIAPLSDIERPRGPSVAHPLWDVRCCADALAPRGGWEPERDAHFQQLLRQAPVELKPSHQSGRWSVGRRVCAPGARAEGDDAHYRAPCAVRARPRPRARARARRVAPIGGLVQIARAWHTSEASLFNALAHDAASRDAARPRTWRAGARRGGHGLQAALRAPSVHASTLAALDAFFAFEQSAAGGDGAAAEGPAGSAAERARSAVEQPHARAPADVAHDGVSEARGSARGARAAEPAALSLSLIHI